ncbi:uncharacterized protein BJ212DRAFT_1479573 [Suillus subaureus]|uniref:Uncharacterized protein n=1 Tax=Suillus subaureus TaxID=48587 RepID=A0A9P7EE58_9AGAM|nr:uncharacterized protein BJ212DRAFT_1479573 [Suillus subaureus]KAG1818565.1 hypothetical protein BJ212DRAFT_1479573 [Suillus subaureus]
MSFSLTLTTLFLRGTCTALHWISTLLDARDAQILQLKNGMDEEDNLQLQTSEDKPVLQTLEDEEEELVVPVPIPLASPCNLLTRHLKNMNPDPDNSTVPWHYCIHPINESHLNTKAKKRNADEQELQERFKKPQKL